MSQHSSAVVGKGTRQDSEQSPLNPPKGDFSNPLNPEHLNSQTSKLQSLHPWAKHVLKFALQMQDMPNYLSIHAGGILISEAPLFGATALQMMPKGFPIVHFDMYAAEEWGYHKYDVLSQRGLGHIKDAVDLVRENQGVVVDIHDVEKIKKDKKVTEQLASGQCMGCFYIESPAMRGLISKLRCRTYTHLVAASSIIRPGVARSGMMREYIQRYHHPNSFEYIHETFKEHLGETFGVMVYQEDVMKILHHFGGLEMDEADVMRRMMTGKKRSSEAFATMQQKYFDNCRARGHSDELAQEVWRQIESFCGYSFCKAHSASFAVESFQSLYLKAYFPLEFMVAVINNFGGFYRTEYYIHELRMSGANVHAPCINHSDYLTNIQGKEVHLGFVHLQGLETKLAYEIVKNRQKHGFFKGMEDFVRRIAVPPSQLDILIRIGAFRFTGLNKGELFWEKNRVMVPPKARAAAAQGLLFEDETEHYELPELHEGQYDQAFDELELLGFPLCSPFEIGGLEVGEFRGLGFRGLGFRELEAVFLKETNRTEKDIDQTPCKHPKKTQNLQTLNSNPQTSKPQTSIIGYYVCRKETRTIKGDRMCFGTWLDCEGRFFDSVHFPDVLKAHPFRGRGLYRITGRLTSDFGFASIEATSMERLPYRTDERWG